MRAPRPVRWLPAARHGVELTIRVAIDARPLLHPHTGIGRYTAELLTRMQRDSAHTFMLYADRPLAGQWRDLGFLVRHGDNASPGLASVFAQIAYPYWCRRDAIDVFWSPRHHLPLAVTAPCLLTIHDLVWRRVPETMHRGGRVLEQLLMPASLRKARRIIAVSDSTARDLRDWMPRLGSKLETIHEAPFVVPEAAPEEHEHVSSIDKIAAEPGYILFVGTFEPRKNLERLLDAYRILTNNLSDCPPLLLAGRPGWHVDVATLLHRHQLLEQVHIVEPCGDAELSALYRDALFLAIPSLYEGFCLPLAEAMAHAKTAITGNVSAMPEVAGDAALLVDPHSVHEIAEAMRRLVTDHALRCELEKRAVKRASAFSWETATLRTLAQLEIAAAQ